MHALSEARRVLRPDGLMIDLRPTARNRQVELELAQTRLFIGEIDSSHTASGKILAEETMRLEQAQRMFSLEHRTQFEYLTDLDTLEDLHAFAADMRRSVMPAEMPARIAALVADIGEDFRIRIRREMMIARYRRR